MTFVNLSLVAGTALVALPIVLHLIMRRKAKLMEFPALRFVRKRHDANRRRLRLRRPSSPPGPHARAWAAPRPSSPSRRTLPPRLLRALGRRHRGLTRQVVKEPLEPPRRRPRAGRRRGRARAGDGLAYLGSRRKGHSRGLHRPATRATRRAGFPLSTRRRRLCSKPSVRLNRR